MSKIILNGSEPDDIILNGITPDKVILNGTTYYESIDTGSNNTHTWEDPTFNPYTG